MSFPNAISSFEKARDLGSPVQSRFYRKALWQLGLLYDKTKAYKQSYEAFKKLSTTSNATQIERSRSEAQARYVRDKFGALIHWVVMDLKVRNDDPYILELGQGPLSSFQGYDSISEEPNVRNQTKAHIQRLFPYLQLEWDGSHLATGLALGSQHVRSQWPKRPENFLPEDLSTYPAALQSRDKAKFPEHVIGIDRASRVLDVASELKSVLAVLTNDSPVAHLFPKTKVFSISKKRSALVSKINTSFPNSKFLILKLPHVEGGQGVKYCPKASLATHLKAFLSSSKSQASHRAANDQLIVQEFVPMANNGHECIIRCSGLLVRDKGVVGFHPTVAYYRQSSLNRNDSSTSASDRLIVRQGASGLTMGGAAPQYKRMADLDKRRLFENLSEKMPVLFNHLLNIDYDETLASAHQQKAKGATSVKDQVYLDSERYYIKNMAEQSHTEIAIQKGEAYLQKNKTDFEAFYVLGDIYYNAEDYPKARRMYNKALTLIPEDNFAWADFIKQCINKVDRAEGKPPSQQSMQDAMGECRIS